MLLRHNTTVKSDCDTGVLVAHWLPEKKLRQQ